MGTELRLPLQVGTSALSGFARASAAFVPGFLLIGSIALPALLAPWDDAISVYPHLIVPYVFAVLIGVALIAYARKHFFLALRERPSDILIGPEGFRVEGGRLNGFKAPWAEVESVRLMGEHAKLEIVEDEGNKRDENFWKLVISTQNEGKVVLGTAEDARERDSLQALCDTIHESIPKTGAPSAPLPDAPARFKCAGCGAPVVPADADMVKCSYCGTPTHIPDDVRTRIRAIGRRDAAAQRSEQMIGKLLHQPGALRTSLIVALAAIPSMLAWPAAIGGAVVLYALCYLRPLNAFLLGIAAFGVIVALFYLVRGQLTDRQALRLLTLSFAAHAPTTAGGAHHCRQCNGPLVAPQGQMLVRCVYCNAENVLGLDARGEAQKGRAQVESLGEALRKRNAERAQWRWSAAAAIAVLAIVAILVRVSAHPPNPLAAIGDARDLKRITFDPFNELQPKPSPDGKQLLYDLRVPGEESDESIMMAPATGAFRGTEMTQEKVHAIRPLWQPNGNGLLYISSTKQRDVLRRVDSLTPYAPSRDLYNFVYDIDVPTMAPDGQHIAFAAAQSKSAGWFIYVGTLDGAQSQQLTAGINAAWSPDGAHIVYTRTLGSYRQVMALTLDETGKLVTTTQLTNEACDHETPVYSPDGAYIAYVGNCNGNKRGKKDLWDLYVMRADGTSNEQLTDGKADVETPAWIGDYVYFSADVASNYDIWRVRLTGPLSGHGGKPAAVTAVTFAPTSASASASATATTLPPRPVSKTGPSTRR